MSTFDGTIREYPFIVVDNFTKRPAGNFVYFLSHCHQDHMRGLQRQFNNRERIVCSRETISILSELGNGKYRKVLNYLTPICFGNPVCMSVGDQEVRVTALPAHHCPGSAMFIFEGVNGSVLYTGDFRVEPNILDQFVKNPFLSYGSQPRFFDNVYLDTTFCYEDYTHFPSRQESITRIIEIISEQMTNTIIHFDCKTFLGYEDIFKHVSKRFGQKVHVTPEMYRIYSALKIDEYFTTNGHSTRFHCCGTRPIFSTFKHHPCSPESPCVSIKPTAFAHRNLDKNDETLGFNSLYSINVPYSMHSSFGELLSFLAFLRPKRVHPLVIPTSDMPIDLHQMIMFLKPFFRKSPLELAEINDEIGAIMKRLKVEPCTSAELVEVPREERIKALMKKFANKEVPSKLWFY